MAKQSKKAFIQALDGGGIGALIPRGSITEEQVRQLARQKKAEGFGRVGRPARKDKDNKIASAAERGTKPGEMRKTYLVSKEQADLLERLAYWDRISVKKALADALQAYFASYQKKNGPLKPIPGNK